MKKQGELKLTEGNIFKGILCFVLPIMLGSLIQQLYIVVDAVIVGQFVGKAGLAAIDSMHTLFKFPINFMNGLSAGATIIISRYFGGRDHRRLDCSVRTAYTLAVLLGLICSIMGVVLSPTMLKWMSVPTEIYDMTLQYCYIYFAGLWSIVLYNMTAGILRALGDSIRPLYILVISSIMNIAGDYVLVGICGFGVSGAAIATLFSQIISVICVLYALKKNMKESIGGIKILPKFCKTHMSKILLTGFPLALQSVMFPISNSIVQANVNSFGTDQIAAWAVCGKMDMVIWLIADAMGPALTTYIAQNIGAGKKERVKKGAFIGMGISATAILASSLGLYVGASLLAHLFVPAKDAALIVPFAVRYMRIMAPFYFFYAVGEAFSGACCGMGDTLNCMIITLISTCLLRIVCVWTVLPRYETMECIIGIYIASWIVYGLIFTIMFLKNLDKGAEQGTLIKTEKLRI